MGKQNFVIEGLKDLMDDLKRLPIDIGDKAKDEINIWAMGVIDEAKTLCPYNPKRKSGTHLKDTSFVRSAASKTRPVALLGFKAPHAWLVENDVAGTHLASHYSTPGTGAKYMGRPFKSRRPALEAKIDQIIAERVK